MIFYLCNGTKCNHALGCHKNGGDCKHTTDHTFAVNPDIDPIKNPDRFEKEIFEVSGRSVVYYWEKEQEENDI